VGIEIHSKDLRYPSFGCLFLFFNPKIGPLNIIEYFTIYNFHILLLNVFNVCYIIYHNDVRKHNMKIGGGIDEKN
jgi:hypothetical protein